MSDLQWVMYGLLVIAVAQMVIMKTLWEMESKIDKSNKIIGEKNEN